MTLCSICVYGKNICVLSRLAQLLYCFFFHHSELIVNINEDKVGTATLLSELDGADLIIALVSPKFLKDGDMIEALQVAINRQRYDECTRLYPVLLNSSLSEFCGGITEVGNQTAAEYKRYCELLLYELSYDDPIWSSQTLGMC